MVNFKNEEIRFQRAFETPKSLQQNLFESFKFYTNKQCAFKVNKKISMTQKIFSIHFLPIPYNLHGQKMGENSIHYFKSLRHSYIVW